MTPKISVIIPMYNAEKYIKISLESLLAQTFKDFEVILVDDCSTDKTLEIAKSFDDERIKILVNEKNFGMPGAVRNVGLEHAQGDYIYFMDNDDMLLPEALETLLNAIEKNNADVVVSIKFIGVLDDGKASLTDMKSQVIQRGTLEKVSSDFKTRVWNELVNHKMHCAPWLFLCKREFLMPSNAPAIKFPDCVAEDVFWLLDILCATDKIVKIDAPLYIWRCRSDSASYTFKRLKENLEGAIRLSKYVEQKLAWTNDFDFISGIAFSIVNGMMVYYLFPKINENPEKASRELTEMLKPTFGENSMFISNLIIGYSLNFK